MMTNKKTAVVTGGTRGIGKQIVKELLCRNYRVYTNYYTDDINAQQSLVEFQEFSNDIQIIKASQDNSQDFDFFISKIKEESKTVDCIVANTGMTLRKNIQDITNEDWETSMQVCLNSHFFLVRDLLNLIPQNSRIIFIGSVLGIYPHSMSLSYGVTKAGIHALAKNLVKYFENTGTTVNVIAPGFVETEWQKNKPMEVRKSIINKTAIKRFGSIDEISKGVLFCLDNEFVNGATIKIDGGYCFK